VQGDRRYPESCNPNRRRPPLSAEQQRLATRYLPLARSLAARLATDASPARDDFEAAACLALVEAAQSFDATRQLDFGVYARPHILGALYDLRRELFMSGCRIKRAGARVPGFVRLDRGLEDRHRIVDSGPELPFESGVESRDEIEGWVKKLPRRHAEVIRHVYLDGRSLQQTARLFGCSASLMSRLHQEAIGMLGEEIGRIP
jgi:RNA polymerase sigma factor (sigma-70 family)